MAGQEQETGRTAALAAAMEQSLYYDALTGLPNRTYFVNELQGALAKAEFSGNPLALLVLDVSDSRALSASVGAESAAQANRGIASAICETIRDGDIVGRLEDGRYGILLTRVQRTADAAIVARKLLDRLNSVRLPRGQRCAIAGSLGVAVYPGDGSDAKSLLKAGEVALTRAHRMGGQTFEFADDTQDPRPEDRRALELALRDAITTGALSLYYQPQVDLVDHRICGVEALLRWDDARFGGRAPQEYLAVVDGSGMSHLLTEWVLREACRQARRWLDDHIAPTTVYVNLSPTQFRQACLPDTVQAVLAEYDLPGSALGVELSEAINLLEPDVVLQNLSALSRLGVRLVLDDFGTGLSSLALLQDYPLDGVKVDRSFVGQMNTNEQSRAIIRTVVAMGRNFGLRVVAEGVETLEQLDYIAHQACDGAQGYLFSQPLPVREISNLLAHPQSLTLTAEH